MIGFEFIVIHECKRTLVQHKALAVHVVPGRLGDDASDPPSRYNQYQSNFSTAVIVISPILPSVVLSTCSCCFPSYGTNADAWLDPSSLIVSLIPFNLLPPLISFFLQFSAQTS